MLALHGAGVGRGIALGKACVLQRDQLEIPEYVLPRHLVEEEVSRFSDAIDRARIQLEEVRTHIPKGAPPETKGFIDAHILMLRDRMLTEAPIDTIRSKQSNAEWALKIHAEALVRVFDEMENPYLRDKRTDVNQVVQRVQRNLLDVEEPEKTALGVGDRIIVAHDLAPADAVLLKSHRVKAFVTSLGGPISHTAILARGLRIPAIVGLHDATRYIRDGEDIIVDGKRGVVIIAPDRRLTTYYLKRMRAIQRQHRQLEILKNSPSVSRDGKTITLLANIELPGDVKSVKKVAAKGVGLYRTEFLFMNRPEAPSEREQFAAYVRVIRALDKMPITIRTLDLGADKQVDGRDQGGNPALGLRAVRLCLNDPAIFRPQLRAILRASAFGPIQIMIPMISSLDEPAQVRALIEETKSELKRDGHGFDPAIPVGGMIEVPAAAISADLFAADLDFLSIGTNDLIQYTLAIDRVDDTVNYLYDPFHPSVLRLIHIVIQAGRRARIPVTMCGEMAGDVRCTRLLLGLGLSIFSMDPANMLEIKKVVRESNLRTLRPLADQVLRARTTKDVYARIEALNATK